MNQTFHITYPIECQCYSSLQVIKGTGIPGSIVNICIDNSYLISTIVDRCGYWQVQVTTTLNSGYHIIYGKQCFCNMILYDRRTIIIQQTKVPLQILQPQNGAVLTENNKPTISGTANPFNSVSVCLSNYSCINVLVNQKGNYKVQFPNELPNGDYIITATEKDKLGNIIATVTSKFTVNIPNPVPSPVITYPPSGAVITNRKPLITGTGVPGYSIELCVPTIGCMNLIVDNNGDFSFQVQTDLADDFYILEATQIDKNGNESPTTFSNFTVQGSGPVPSPTITYPENGSTINNRRPLIQGTGVPGYSIELCGPITCNYLPVDSNGNYSYQVPTDLVDDKYGVVATQYDKNGNRSISTEIFFTVKGTNPVPSPTIIYPENGSTINNTRPLIQGTGVPGYSIRLCDSSGGCVILAVDTSGIFSLQVNEDLPYKQYTLTVIQIDGQGNESDEVVTTFTVAP